jgi:hypothetical protein
MSVLASRDRVLRWHCPRKIAGHLLHCADAIGNAQQMLAKNCPVKDEFLAYQCDAFSKTLAEAIERANASIVPGR